jgi:pyridoxal phosphate enzyme (YggS family)
MDFYLKKIKQNIPNHVRIVGATKYFTAPQMRELYNEGLHDFGENRDDAFLQKVQLLSDLDITWHFIGTLQTKKVKKVINYVDYLHSLDSLKLAQEINKRRNAPLKCFIEVNISQEESKHGFSPKEVIPFLKEIEPLENINVIGLMGMASHTNDTKMIHQQFQILNTLQKQILNELGISLNDLSIGMSNDYLIALKHHATFVRLGSILFKKEV